MSVEVQWSELQCADVSAITHIAEYQDIILIFWLLIDSYLTMPYDNTGNAKSAGGGGDEEVKMETEERHGTQESSVDSNEEKKEGEGTNTNTNTNQTATTQVTQTIRIPTKTRDGDSRRSTEFHPDTFLELVAENQNRVQNNLDEQ